MGNLAEKGQNIQFSVESFEKLQKELQQAIEDIQIQRDTEEKMLLLKKLKEATKNKDIILENYSK